MILEKLISMICEEFGFSEDEVDGSAPLYEFINDDAELRSLSSRSRASLKRNLPRRSTPASPSRSLRI